MNNGLNSRVPGPYSHPEAYDIINSPGTPSEVDGLERIAARLVLDLPLAEAANARTLRWLEPCSGSGRFVRLIASRMARPDRARRRGSKRAARRAGRIIGIDIDDGMVGYTRDRLARLGLERYGSVVRADIRRFTARTLANTWTGNRRPTVDVAFCLHNSIRHLATTQDMTAHLRAVRRVLAPRGIYIVGLELTPPEQMMTSESVFVGTRGSTMVREVFNYLPPSVDEPPESPPMETVMTHLEITRIARGSGKAGAAPRLESEWSTTYQLRCWSLEEWRAMVKRAGLRELGVFDSWGAPMADGYRRYALRVLSRA